MAAIRPGTSKTLLQTVRNRVRRYLRQMVGRDGFQEFDDRFVLQRGSATIQVVVRPWHRDDAVVEAIAYLTDTVPVTPELMEFLLRKNATLHFGAFGLAFDRTIVFTHSIAGRNLDPNELRATVETVGAIADYYDDHFRRGTWREA